MTKINPNLDDWWTNSKTTEIRLFNDHISGLGISIKVLLNVFLEENFTYLSIIDGAFDDNLYIIVLDDEQSKSLELKEKHKESAIENWYGEKIEIEEFKLSQQIMEQIGLLDLSKYHKWNYEKCRYKIHSHDNFIVDVGPVDEELIRKILSNIKKLHNFYLDAEIRNNNFEDIILKELQTREEVRIKSIENKTFLQYKEKSKNVLKRLLGIKEKKEILLNEL